MAQCLSQRELSESIEKLNAGKPVKWQIKNERLCKEFNFESFQDAFAFMTQCALSAEKMDHHPEWCNCYNKVSVQLTTHSAGGITLLDVELASIMDLKAGNFAY